MLDPACMQSGLFSRGGTQVCLCAPVCVGVHLVPRPHLSEGHKELAILHIFQGISFCLPVRVCVLVNCGHSAVLAIDLFERTRTLRNYDFNNS